MLKVFRPFDDLTGGLKEGVITLVYGPPASGKSTLCLAAAISCSLEGKNVAYISREKQCITRLEQMCSEKSVMGGIRFAFPETINGLENAVRNIREMEHLGLVIIDPVNSYYWDEEDRESVFIRVLAEVSMIGKEKEIPVLISADVYEKKRGFEPFGFRDMKRVASCVVELEPGRDRRNIRVIKGEKGNSKTQFSITQRGLED